MVFHCLTISARVARVWLRHAGVGSTHGGSSTGTRTSLNRRVGAEHTNTGAELGSTKRDHVFANVLSNNLTMLRVGVREDVLDEVVSILIARNVNQGNARTIVTTLTNSIEIAGKEVNTTNFEALLNNFGSKLIHAVLRSIANDMVNRPATISGSTVLTDVLNAPITELTVSNNVDAGKNFFNTRALCFMLAYISR
jgi:hypothetical protein